MSKSSNKPAGETGKLANNSTVYVGGAGIANRNRLDQPSTEKERPSGGRKEK